MTQVGEPRKIVRAPGKPEEAPNYHFDPIKVRPEETDIPVIPTPQRTPTREPVPVIAP